MTNDKIYDIAVVGGGLAGLSLSIQLAKAGYDVILFEKEKYPFHKVCGEYISLESWNFIPYFESGEYSDFSIFYISEKGTTEIKSILKTNHSS